MLDLAMVAECSPNIHPMIVQAIVKTESAYNPFAIGVNKGAGRLSRQPTNYQQAVATAKQLLSIGANIDMGLGQINSANMRWLGLSVEQAFNPCSNLKSLQAVYLNCYNRAGNSGQGTKEQRAWSCYNTGNIKNGFANGYVAKVTHNFNQLVNAKTPQIQPVYQSPISNIPQKRHISSTETHKAQVPESTTKGLTDAPMLSNDVQLSQPETPKNISTNDEPIKAHHNWDIFRDF